MPRIAKGDIHAALARAADHIRDAAGQDGVTSRNDIKGKIDKLSGTEKQLVDMFFRFVDHRDAGAGARITKKDVDRALDYAKDKLIDAYDLNNNGLSKAEIADMSRIGQLATQLAQELKSATPAGRGPDALSDAMRAAVDAGHLQVDWNDGHVASARVSTDWDNRGMDPAAMLRELLALPESETMTRLTIGMANADGDNDYGEVIDAITSAGSRPALTDLHIGDFTSDDCEISWSTVGGVGALYDLMPNLESLTLHGGGIGLGRLEHDKLKSLTIESGGLPGDAARSVGSANLPKLESLEVWFGSEEYGAGGDAAMLAGLMRGDGVPALTNLGLRNAEFTDDMVRSLVDARVLGQLETLDLSMGTLTNDGAALIEANADAFRHLNVLDLSDNFLTDDVAARLTDLFGSKVKVGNQKYDSYDPDYRYVSVGE